MRIVCTSDTHFPFKEDRVPEGDVFIHAGDLMYEGTPGEWQSRIDSLKALPHKIKILVPGNHDYHIQNYEGVAAAQLRKAGVKLLGLANVSTKVGGLTILGLPWVTNLRGWAFDRDETWVQEYMTHMERADIIVSHAPPFNILDAIRPERLRARERENVGCLAYNRWFYGLDPSLRPSHWLVGHIHESYGTVEIEGTKFMNAAMCDRDYKQSNEAMVIDL